MRSEKRGSWRTTYQGSDLPPVVRRLGAVSFFQDVASEMVYPLLPGFLVALGGGPGLLGVMESASEGVVAFVKAWAGRASDRSRRRKPFVAFGYGGSAIARPLLAWVVAPWQLVAVRVWDRFAKGIRSAPRDALIAGSIEPARRSYAFAFHRGLDHLGAATGPLAAAALLALGASTRSIFLAATLPALIGFVTVLVAVPGEPVAGATRERRAPPGASSPALRRALVAAGLFGLANASDAFLLLRAGELGLPAASLALLWSVFHVVRWLASAPGGRLADRLGARTALVAGWTAYALLYAGFGLAPSRTWFLLLLLPYAAHVGLVEGAERTLAVELGGERAAGTALGAWHRATGLGALGASLLFGGIAAGVSMRVAFFTGGALALAAALVVAGCRPADGASAGAAGGD